MSIDFLFLTRSRKYWVVLTLNPSKRCELRKKRSESEKKSESLKERKKGNGKERGNAKSKLRQTPWLLSQPLSLR